MKIYQVTIQATVTKTYEIETDDPATAETVAHEIFSFENEPDIEEKYEQQTISVKG